MLPTSTHKLPHLQVYQCNRVSRSCRSFFSGSRTRPLCIIACNLSPNQKLNLLIIDESTIVKDSKVFLGERFSLLAHVLSPKPPISPVPIVAGARPQRSPWPRRRRPTHGAWRNGVQRQKRMAVGSKQVLQVKKHPENCCFTAGEGLMLCCVLIFCDVLFLHS